MKFSEQSATQTQKQSSNLKNTQKCETMRTSQQKLRKKSKQSRNTLRWTYQENLLYVRFLRQHFEKIIKTNSKSEKKFFKFERMSASIVSKTANQCRSHHQKMMNRFKTLPGIIEGLITKKQMEMRQTVDIQEESVQKLVIQEQKRLENQVQQKTQHIFQDEIQSIDLFGSEIDQRIFDVLFQFEKI